MGYELCCGSPPISKLPDKATDSKVALHRWLFPSNTNQAVMLFDSCHSGTKERGVFTANLVPGQQAAVTEPELIDGMDDDFNKPQRTRGT